jgi:hypothetical protein
MIGRVAPYIAISKEVKYRSKGDFMAKYGRAAGAIVEREMQQFKKGKLKSGKSGKIVTNPKQAIAMGLSEARKKGAKVPMKKG